jgi:hypothetical protein
MQKIEPYRSLICLDYPENGPSLYPWTESANASANEVILIHIGWRRATSLLLHGGGPIVHGPLVPHSMRTSFQMNLTRRAWRLLKVQLVCPEEPHYY